LAEIKSDGEGELSFYSDHSNSILKKEKRRPATIDQNTAFLQAYGAGNSRPDLIEIKSEYSNSSEEKAAVNRKLANLTIFGIEDDLKAKMIKEKY